MRKSLGLVLVCLLTIGIISACGSNDADNKQGAGDSDRISGEITVWAWGLEEPYLANVVLPEFEKEYPDVTVKIEKIGNEQIYDKLIAGLASGGAGLPDVTQIAVNKLPIFVEQFPDGFADVSALGFDKHVEDFPESTIEQVKNNEGKIVALPRDLGPVGVFYRVDIFEEAGVDPSTIETWDDYIEAGEIILDKTGVQMLGNRIGEQDDILNIMMQQQGVYYFDADGKIAVNNEETLRALNKIKEMNEAGILLNTSNWDGQVAAMKNGKVATIPDAVWWSGTMIDQMPELSGKWAMFPLPVFEDAGVHAANNGGSALAIINSSENQKAAYAFAEFASAKEETQIKGLENYGLFPAYEPSYELEYFNSEQEYFNNQAIFKDFAEIVPNVPTVNFTEDNLLARQVGTDQLAALVLQGADPESVLENLESQIKQQTGREVK